VINLDFKYTNFSTSKTNSFNPQGLSAEKAGMGIEVEKGQQKAVQSKYQLQCNPLEIDISLHI